jgi:hypothetical protein
MAALRFEEHSAFRRLVSFILKEKVMRRTIFPLLATASIVIFWAGSSPALANGYKYCLLGKTWGLPGSCEFSTFDGCLAFSWRTGFGCVVDPRYAFAKAPRPKKNRNRPDR